jgi:hypothetical protein
MGKKKRVNPTKDVETALLINSKRRCCLCFGLQNDDTEKEGQIAHLDGDPANSEESNLAYLCMRHHTLKDSTTSQHKNFTVAEVVHWKEKLYKHLEKQEKKARDKTTWEEELEQRYREAMQEMSLQSHRNFIENQAKLNEDATERSKAFREAFLRRVPGG